MHEPVRPPNWKLYALLWVLMLALRQDFWLWRDPSLVFGLLPVGLAYQAGYSGLAALVMWALVTYDWPAALERFEREEHEGDRS